MPIFYQPDISTGYFPEDESKHAVRVLRLEEGDQIEIVDGKGKFYQAIITTADSRKCGFKITDIKEIARNPFTIHLAIAPTKNTDRIEWMIEKCVEIGVDKVSFIQCKTSERKSFNTDRLSKIVISALKQSQKAWLPELNAIQPVEGFIKSTSEIQKFIAYVDSSNPDHLKNLVTPNQSYVVMIGPEGDFTSDELKLAVDSGFKKVSLGPSRLRTETAGMSAVMILNFMNQ